MFNPNPNNPNNAENDQNALKDAFERIKNDIFSLTGELNLLKSELSSVRSEINTMNLSLNTLSTQTQPTNTSTHPSASTDTSTVPMEIQGSRYPNLDISSGNGGASTDRQTIRQTDTSTHNAPNNTQMPPINPQVNPNSLNQQISDASEILTSLDQIKLEIKRKFKTLTDQEMLVFSTIYQLEDLESHPDYRTISLKLGLSESSIRDYVQRMIVKGIPIAKTKHNNKKITLSVGQELRRIATLPTLLQLREI